MINSSDINVKSDSHARKKNIISSYVSQFLQYGASLIVLPVVLCNIPSDELGVWYVFLTIAMFVNLLDFGFLPTVMRYISYVFSGAQELAVGGISARHDARVNYKLLKTIICVVRCFYAFMALIVAISLCVVGHYYVIPIILKSENVAGLRLAWVVYAVSSCFSVYFCYYSGLLSGRGCVHEYNLSVIVGKIVYVAFCILGVALGYGVVSIAFGNAVSIIVSRYLENRFLYDDKLTFFLGGVDVDWENFWNYLILLCKSSYKLGLVSVGAFLILRVNILLSARYLDLQDVAQYGLSLQLVQVLAVLSGVLYNSQLPVFHRLRVINDHGTLLEYFSVSVVVAWCIYILGGLFVLFFGDDILLLVGSRVGLMSFNNMTILLILNLLELNHSIFANFITTKNIVPFVYPAIVSGVLIGVLSFFMLVMTNLGITGMLLVQFVVQLMYNNWKWPLVVFREFNVNFLGFGKIAIRSVFILPSR